MTKVFAKYIGFVFLILYYRESVVSECEVKIQELKDTISQLNLEKTELVTKVSLPDLDL